MVRADPDVMMVGEIRDRETAQIAIESALTGHLVLSTMHTNDAPMAAARLIDMGIEPFLIASGLECVVAQRLARRLCEEPPPGAGSRPTELKRSGRPNDGGGFDGYEPGGCVRCGGSGYRGRVGIYEVMALSDEIRSLILRKASRTRSRRGRGRRDAPAARGRAREGAPRESPRPRGPARRARQLAPAPDPDD